MHELTKAFHQAVAEVDPVGDLADVHRRAASRGRRAEAVRRGLAVGAVTVAVAGLGWLLVTAPTGQQRTATVDQSADSVPKRSTSTLSSAALPATGPGPDSGQASPPGERVDGVEAVDGNGLPIVPSTIEDVGGLIISDAGPVSSYHNGTLERQSQNANSGGGALSVVIRSSDGQLGAGSVVITYPTDDGQPGETLDDGSTVERWTGVVGGHAVASLSVDLGGSWLTARSAGVSEVDLRAIVAAVGIEGGRIVIDPDGLPAGFAAVASAPVTPTVIREARYGCDSLDEPVLGALCYSDLSTGPGFEWVLYQLHQGWDSGPPIDGHPSVVSMVGGGNGTLAWEPQPGVIAYVGYSGNPMGDEQIAALARLAARAQLLAPDDWAATKPLVSSYVEVWN